MERTDIIRLAGRFAQLALEIGAALFVAWRLRLLRRRHGGRVPLVIGGSDRTHRGEGDADGAGYRWEHSLAGKVGASSFLLTVDAACDGDFALVDARKTPRPLIPRRWTLGDRLATGDTEFDRSFLGESDTPGMLRFAFAEQARREAAAELLRLGYSIVRHDGKAIEAFRSPFEMESDFRLEEIELAAHCLRRIAAGLECFEVPRIGRFRVPRLRWILGIAIPIGLLVGVLFLAGVAAVRIQFLPNPDIHNAMLRGLPLSIPLGAGYAAFQAWLIRGRMRSTELWLAGSCVACVAFFFGGATAIMAANVALDRSPAALLDGYIQALPTRGPGSYPAEFSYLDGQTDEMESSVLRLRREEYENLARKPLGYSRVALHMRKGAFGMPWVESYRFTPEAEPRAVNARAVRTSSPAPSSATARTPR